jgi:hypothetical protein
MRSTLTKILGKCSSMDETDESAHGLENAFPADVRAVAGSVAGALPTSYLDHNGGSIGWTLEGVELTAPYRIYKDEPRTALVSQLDATGLTVLHCLYTRHRDGQVRQRHLGELLASDHIWVMPFIAQLLAEYVVHIHEDIARAFEDGTINRDAWTAFAAQNHDHLLRIRTRYISYLTQFGWTWSTERPGSQLAGRDAFAAMGLWPARFARRITRRASRWHLPPYSPGSTNG